MKNPNMQYFGNVLLKINTKIGGRNVQLANTPAILQQPTMVLGADVTHPGPLSGGSSTTPSIAAVVASMDQYVTQFTSSIRLQPPRCEEIQALKEMMVELLKTFREKLGVFPQRIIFFRDGVSEGQFMVGGSD